MTSGNQEFKKDNQRIKNAVNSVISGQFKLPSYKEGEYTIYPKTPGQVDDPTREFKDLATDIVVNEFVKYSNELSLFIYTISSTFDTALQYYRLQKSLPEKSVVFVYKGGNILRLIAHEFLNELPGAAADIIFQYYNPGFKQSDADFSIYVDPRLDNFANIYADITLISYQLLVYLRDVFEGHETKFFNFRRYNDEYKTERLNKYLGDLNNTATIQNPESEYYNSQFVMLQNRKNTSTSPPDNPNNLPTSIGLRKDMVVTTLEKDPNTIITYDIDDENNPNKVSDYYISVNTALKFMLEDQLMHFNLVRMKVNFVMYNAKNGEKINPMQMGGELIDVSIPAQDTAGIRHFFEEIDNNIKEFKMEKPFPFKFIAPTIEYLIEDLELILFKTVEYPWIDRKYVKRVNRLLFLYFIDLIAVDASLKDKEGFISEIGQNIINPLSSFDTLDESAKKLIKENISKKAYESKTYGIKFEKFFVELERILTQVMTRGTAEDKEELKKFVQVVDNNLQTMIQTMSELHGFVKNNGTIDKSKIYDVDVQMGGLRKKQSSDLSRGGSKNFYHKKYLSYKNKYMSAKKNISK